MFIRDGDVVAAVKEFPRQASLTPFTWVRGGRESEEESTKRKCSEDHSETERDALMVHLKLFFFLSLVS